MLTVNARFTKETYSQRRRQLKRRIGSGLLLLSGNALSPMNFGENHYPFRQDSTFLYYCGLDRPGLNALLLDVDHDRDILYGEDLTPEAQVWCGPQPTLAESAKAAGLDDCQPAAKLADTIARAVSVDRAIHVLPPYRPEHTLVLQDLLRITAQQALNMGSKPFIQAVIAQRSVKTESEIEEIEDALAVARQIHLRAMDMTRPGRFEYEVVAAMQAAAYEQGARLPAFPIIFSSHGEILHPRSHGNRLQSGQLVINDSGVESLCHYASDITRTLPVSGAFTQRQKDIYNLVLSAQQNAIAAVAPGVRYRDLHLAAARHLAQGLKDVGLLRGDLDAIMQSGAYALFFPHGLGHMMGLDVHDMENLGEDLVGYDDTLRRSTKFGLSSLRLARELQPGFVITVEPGLYFIPELIDRWRSQKRSMDLIDYEALEAYRHFGGVRIEDDVLVTSDGCRVLGPPIVKKPEAVEERMQQAQDRRKKGLGHLKADRSRLIQSEKLASLGQLAAGVAHEINNPVGFVKFNLHAIQDYCSGLLRYVQTCQEMRAKVQAHADPVAVLDDLQTRLAVVCEEIDLDYILKDLDNVLAESIEGLDRVAKIVSDLKNFAHVENDIEAWADLNQEIESTLNIVWNQIKYKAEVVKDLEPLPAVRCFPQRINQVFMNLLVNAAQAIAEKGLITVKTRSEKDTVAICISDTGGGIAPDNIPRIFDPFFTTKPPGQGTGLGLDVAANIVRNHQGSIEVDSTPGKGTTFTVRLPVAPPLNGA